MAEQEERARSDASALLLETPLPRLLLVTLNRPNVHNALDRRLINALGRVLDAAASDETVGAIILTGAGRSFCSGDDLKALRDEPLELFRETIDGLQSLTAQIVASPKPVIAALNGPAYGAGLELVLACDLRIATEAFAAATPEVRLGLLATNGASVLLPILIGPSRAREMLMGGELKPSQWCLGAGLIDEITSDDALLPRAFELASTLAQGAPGAIAATRRLLNAPLRAVLGNALREEAQACVAARETVDGAEGIDAYFARRPPIWSGR